jgi:hypothetical protein
LLDVSHKKQGVFWSFYTSHWFVCLVLELHLFWDRGISLYCMLDSTTLLCVLGAHHSLNVAMCTWSPLKFEERFSCFLWFNCTLFYTCYGMQIWCLRFSKAPHTSPSCHELRQVSRERRPWWLVGGVGPGVVGPLHSGKGSRISRNKLILFSSKNFINYPSHQSPDTN